MYIVHSNVENPTQQMPLDFEREFISPTASTRNLTVTKFPASKFESIEMFLDELIQIKTQSFFYDVIHFRSNLT